MKKIKVRFAPSPTGFLHIGGLRTALYDYLFAQKNKGDFLLRIEDTDQKRFVQGAEENLIETLKYFDLNWEGEITKQSERLEIYKKYAEELVKKGYAYYCFCQPERLEEMRKEQSALKKPPIYDRYCLKNLSQEEVNKKLKENCSYTIRLKIPEGKIFEFEDMVRGKVKFSSDVIDDTVLLKSDGFPTYHLANVVDDHEMGITHVIRGEEWLPSAPKHLCLYEYFNWEKPQFAHLPLLLNSDRSKLSKRQGDVAVEEYLKKGYLKEALLNFVAFLGWNPGGGETKEIFSLEDLVKKFDFSHVHKAGAVFDLEKLNWINSQWIKKISLDDLYQRALPYYENFLKNKKIEKEFLKKVLVVERDRLFKLSEVGENNKFFFEDINYDKELLHWKDMSDEKLRENLNKTKGVLENIAEGDWNLKKLEESLMKAAGENKGEFLWPLRVAVTGEKKSPSPFECVWVLGKKESLKRVQEAMEKI